MSSFNSLDGTEKKLTREQLEEKYSVLQKMLNTIDVAIWSFDIAAQRYSYMTEAITQITGFPLGKLMESRFWMGIIHQEDLPEFEQMLINAERGNPVLKEFRIYHANGERKWIQIRIMPTMDGAGRATKLDGAVIDITSSKVMEEALQRSEQRYKSLFEYNSDVLCELDLEGNVLAINPAAERITGEHISSTEDNSSTILDIVGDDNLRLMTEYFQKAIRGQSGSYEVTSFHRNKNIFHWEMKNVPIYVNDQIVGAFAIAKDITAKKEVEKELRDSEERYRRLLELTPQPMVSHRDGVMNYMNPAGYHLLGAVSVNEVMGKSIFDIVHPDDREKMMDQAGQVVHKKFIGSIEYKLIRLDGQVLAAESTGIYDDKSGTTLVLFNDITERKKMERDLLVKEERYRRLVELSPVAIAVYKDGVISYINPAGIKMLSLEFNGEPIPANIADWIHPDYCEYAIERMMNTLLNGYSPPGEYKIRSADGHIIEVSMISIYDPYSSSIQIMFEDISDRKKAEEDRRCSELIIRESEDRYFRLQTSLDRFSQDLFGVMKVDQMERRFVKEVRSVMNTAKVSMVEMDHNNEAAIRYGELYLPESIRKCVRKHKELPICQILETDEGCYLKIGEAREKSYLLCIGERAETLMITSKKVWLETISRYVSVLFDNFLLIEDLTKEIEQMASQQVAPSWLLRLLFNLSENERKHLSQDLHDAALQEQIIWYRKLDLILTDEAIPSGIREQLEQVSQGLLDVIYQIRITCNELRPPMLKEEGLTSSLEMLFDFTQLRTNYSIQFDATQFENIIHDDMLIGLYRIVQELLANATKHSHATEVRIRLSSQPNLIELEYKDNGVGMDLMGMEVSFKSMGIYGMKERVRSMDGTIEFLSSQNNGLLITIAIPV